MIDLQNLDKYEQAFCDGYDAGTSGCTRPHVGSPADVELQSASELGYMKGVANERSVRAANRNDPSADFLCRSYHRSAKIQFIEKRRSYASS